MLTGRHHRSVKWMVVYSQILLLNIQLICRMPFFFGQIWQVEYMHNSFQMMKLKRFPLSLKGLIYGWILGSSGLTVHNQVSFTCSTLIFCTHWLVCGLEFDAISMIIFSEKSKHAKPTSCNMVFWHDSWKPNENH